MPPKTTAPDATRRKGPAFNPPRPVKVAAQAASSKRAPTAKTARSAGATSKASTAKRVHKDTTIISSDEEEAQEEEDELIDSNDDDLMEEDAPVRDNRRQRTPPSDTHPIPAPLLMRLIHENFEDANTQIQRGALNLVGKYMDIFVREALARAKHERSKSVKGGGISDGFLQVEDLEKLAPQLVLDF